MQAASPDEAALVTAAKRFGFMFKARSPGSVTISCPPSQGYSSGSLDETYQVLAVLEFSSARKRQSVVLRQPDGSVILYCKVSFMHAYHDHKKLWQAGAMRGVGACMGKNLALQQPDGTVILHV